MLAFAAILFAIAWIINATGTATNAWFSVTDLLLIGLACLALHQAGIGSAWVRRRLAVRPDGVAHHFGRDDRELAAFGPRLRPELCVGGVRGECPAGR